MDYAPIIEKLRYWREYTGKGDAYRKTHDSDCILTGGNLLADTLFSLWLPLRYTLNAIETPAWTQWRTFEYANLRGRKLYLKNHKPFLLEMERDIERFLPQHELTGKLIQLFELGQKRCNVILLPERSWNNERGRAPYWDYVPHFLYNKLDKADTKAVAEWIRREQLGMFFHNGCIEKEALLDLAGTGKVQYHAPGSINLPFLLKNYVCLLEQRDCVLGLTA